MSGRPPMATRRDQATPSRTEPPATPRLPMVSRTGTGGWSSAPAPIARDTVRSGRPPRRPAREHGTAGQPFGARIGAVGGSRRGMLARAGAIVTIAFLVARILGWIELVIIGAVYPASDRDMWVAAFRIPDLIFQLAAAGALSSALIPVVAGLFALDEDERAWRVASTVANLTLAVLAGFAILVAIIAPVLVPIFTPGFGAAEQARTVDLTRIMLLSPILLTLGTVATSLLNAKGRFLASALAPIAYNLGIIFGALVLSAPLGVVGVTVGVVIGAAAHLGIQLWPLRGIGFRFTPKIDLQDPSAREAVLLMVPRAFGLGASQLTFLVATSMASTVGVGAVSAFYFAFSIFQIPIGVIGFPVGVVMLPSMSRDHATGDVSGYVSLVTRALRLILWVMLPLAGLTIVLRRELVVLLFRSGRFEERDIQLTVAALAFLALALASEALINILARAFYARRDTLTPVIAAILAVAINVTLAFLFVGPFGLAGIGFAIAAGSWAEFTLLLLVLDRRIETFKPAAIVQPGAIALGAALAASIVGFLVRQGFVAVLGESASRPVVIVEMIVITVVGAAVYLGISRQLRVPELETLVNIATDVVPRLRPLRRLVTR